MLEKWAQSYRSPVSSPLFLEHITTICKKMPLAFQNMMRPAYEHEDTSLKKNSRPYSRGFHGMESGVKQFSANCKL